MPRMDAGEKAKKKTKSLTRSLSFKIMETDKCCPLAFHSYKFLSFVTVQGVWMLCPKVRTHPVLRGTLLFSAFCATDFRKKLRL